MGSLSREGGGQGAFLEEAALQFLVDREGEVKEVHWGADALLHAEHSFVTRHICLHVPRTAAVHLHSLLHHFFPLTEQSEEDIHAKFRYPITPFRPSFSFECSGLNCTFILLEKGVYILFSKMLAFEACLQVRPHFAHAHPSRHGTKRDDLAVGGDQREQSFGEIDCPVEVGGEGEVQHSKGKLIALDRHPRIVYHHIHSRILLLYRFFEGTHTLCIGHIEQFQIDVCSRIDLQDLKLGLLAELDIANSHNDNPIWSSGEFLCDSEPYSLVAACDNDLPYSLH